MKNIQNIQKIPKIPKIQKIQKNRGRDRLIVVIVGFALLFSVAATRLVHLGLQERDESRVSAPLRDISLMASRPRILDRHGSILAMDIPVRSLFAEPRLIQNPDETYESLVTVLPDLDYTRTKKRLTSGLGFVWLRRELTPAQQHDILALGLPGIGFRDELRRFYPSGSTLSHVLGTTNIDNRGMSGIERHLDDSGLRALHNSGFGVSDDHEPVRLSIDLRVQHIIRSSLSSAMERYQAIAASGVLIDVHTGEILGLSSLPDYNPNNPSDAFLADRLNRVSGGVFELGSIFKIFTTAMALDSNLVDINSRFDATRPLRYGRFTIDDFLGKRRILTVPETFIYSSNIATAKMARTIGISGHREFLGRLGLLDRVSFELPEIATPVSPRRWGELTSVTASYGHGLSTTPLQTAVAASALMNGGYLVSPTLFLRSEGSYPRRRVIKESTSDLMRNLMRLNVLRGSGRNSDVPGFFVGGKTGTSEKVIDGEYSDDHRLNTFLAMFPSDSPRYLLLVVIDEPQVEEGEVYATAGMNAAPVSREIIERSALLLGVTPQHGSDDLALSLVSLGGSDDASE